MGRAFKRRRREERVQMPRKMARFAARPPFGLSEVRVAVGTGDCLVGRPEKRQYSRQFGSHPGNPG